MKQPLLPACPICGKSAVVMLSKANLTRIGCPKYKDGCGEATHEYTIPSHAYEAWRFFAEGRVDRKGENNNGTIERTG